MRIFFTVFALLLSIVAFSSCAPVKFYQKERLADRTMIFDYDTAVSAVRSDIVTTREGSIGGFSSANAAGCSCK